MVSHHCFEGTSIGEAYSNAISNVDFRDSITFEISRPVDNLSTIPVKNVDDSGSWENCLNFGPELDPFLNSDIGDQTGEEWIDQQFHLHTSGAYQEQAEKVGLEDIKNELKGIGPGTIAPADYNKLVIPLWENTQSIFEGEYSCSCLTQLQFKPQKDNLHLYAVFRSQALFSKAPGNLLGLAAQLAMVCDETDFQPGKLISTAHNIPDMGNNRAMVREVYADEGV